MPTEWIRNNLSLSNLILICLSLIGIGFYYRGQELKADALNFRIVQLENDMKDLKDIVQRFTISSVEVNWKLSRLGDDMQDIKKEVQATRKAVQ